MHNELTQKDLQLMREELDYRRVQLRPKLLEAVKEARAFGDLSENAEYDAAKKEEAHVYGRIAELEELLRTATFVDDTAVSTDTVAVGTVVRVLDEEFNEEDEYTLVGFTEADPTKLFISQESPIGEALVGKRVGDRVDVKTPGGIVKMKVLSIRKR